MDDGSFSRNTSLIFQAFQTLFKPVCQHMTTTNATFKAISGLLLLCVSGACSSTMPSTNTSTTPTSASADVKRRLDSYTTVRLAPDLSALSANERKMIPILIEAAKAMDEVYWIQTYGE